MSVIITNMCSDENQFINNLIEKDEMSSDDIMKLLIEKRKTAQYQQRVKELTKQYSELEQRERKEYADTKDPNLSPVEKDVETDEYQTAQYKRLLVHKQLIDVAESEHDDFCL